MEWDRWAVLRDHGGGNVVALRVRRRKEEKKETHRVSFFASWAWAAISSSHIWAPEVFLSEVLVGHKKKRTAGGAHLSTIFPALLLFVMVFLGTGAVSRVVAITALKNSPY